ncbi:MAG TPA: radical SAM protein [Deltaproteobacteria bacterium]|nr:radical SAM protein [Deltaproteobacteria bacterium]
MPVFVSNLGCPGRCVFCNQAAFSTPVEPAGVRPVVERFLAGCARADTRRRVVAFFGGTFTALGPRLLDGYLAETRRLVEDGIVHAAKASTRPDAVDPAVLDRLAGSGFDELEIGVQSFDDRVLDASGRGHTAADAVRASRVVRSAGLRLGIQLMPGLPGEDPASFRRTVGTAASLRPDTARIYPTVVLAGTQLEALYRSGEYTPLSLGEAVKRSLYAMARLEGGGCTILRMGLPQAGGLDVVAGPFHPAFGFLVRSEAYRIMAASAVDMFGPGCRLTVNPKSLCELIGHGRGTVENLTFAYDCDDTVPWGEVRVRAGDKGACIQLKDILEYIL